MTEVDNCEEMVRLAAEVKETIRAADELAAKIKKDSRDRKKKLITDMEMQFRSLSLPDANELFRKAYWVDEALYHVIQTAYYQARVGRKKTRPVRYDDRVLCACGRQAEIYSWSEFHNYIAGKANAKCNQCHEEDKAKARSESREAQEAYDREVRILRATEVEMAQEGRQKLLDWYGELESREYQQTSHWVRLIDSFLAHFNGRCLACNREFRQSYWDEYPDITVWVKRESRRGTETVDSLVIVCDWHYCDVHGNKIPYNPYAGMMESYPDAGVTLP